MKYKWLVVMLMLPGLVSAGQSCVMDEVISVDTSGNTTNACWVTGYMTVGGEVRAIKDLNICMSPNESSNSRNLSVALMAFTAKKKLAFWFSDYSSCEQVKPRWENGVGRISIRN